MRIFANGYVYGLILIAVALFAWEYFAARGGEIEERGIYQILADAKAGKIARIEANVRDSNLLVTYRDEAAPQVRSRVERNDSITRLLVQAGVPLGAVDVVVNPPSLWQQASPYLTIFLPALLVMLITFALMLRMRT